MKGTVVDVSVRDGFEVEGTSLRSEGGDSAHDSRDGLAMVGTGPNQKGFEESDVRGLRVGTLLEVRPLRMLGLPGMNGFRL